MLAIILGALSGLTKQRTTLGRYELQDKIGEGAMGVLYRARQLGLDRDVAVKVCKLRDADSSKDQFQREARVTAELSHPNTVSVFDSGITRDGSPYYVMELLDGADLEQRVDRDGPLSSAQVVDVLAQLADALIEVHGRGLVHQDIKPANVVLTDDGVAKLIDFGLVRDDSGCADDGKYRGTPAFSAPEQITGADAVGPHSDIYALGALAFYLLTGRPVFGGENVAVVCSRHLYDTAPSASACSERDVPAELDALIAECLRKSPTDRPTARAMRDRLRRIG